jgi:hypothetical protein
MREIKLGLTPEGCQSFRKFTLTSGTPPGCDPINIASPVVSADSDPGYFLATLQVAEVSQL